MAVKRKSRKSTSTRGFGRNPRPGPGRPKGSKDKKPRGGGPFAKASRELIATHLKQIAAIDPKSLKHRPYDVMHSFMAQLWEAGEALDAEKPGAGFPLKEAACKWAKECAPYVHAKPAPTQPMPDLPDTPNVVRVPLPAQSAESWQAEADAYLAQQARIHAHVGSPNKTIN